MDGQHLHRLAVRLQPPAAVLVGDVLAGLGDPAAQPRRQGGDAEPAGHRLAVEQLADVAQIGERALAVRTGEQAGRQALAVGDRLEQGGDATAAQAARPRGAPGRRCPPTSASSAVATCSADQPTNVDRARARTRVDDDGRSSASRRALQSRATGARNTLPAPLITAGTPTASRASRTVAASRLRLTRTAMCPGRTGSGRPSDLLAPVHDDLGCGRQQGDDIARQIGGDHPARRVDRGPLPCCVNGDEAVVAMEHAHAQRGGLRRTDQSWLLVIVGGAHGAVLDPGVAEPRPAHQGVVGVDQRLVAAPVDAERRLVSWRCSAASR